MGNSDTKTMFRDQVQQLLNKDIGDSTEWLISLVTLPTCIDDIYSMICPQDVKKLILDRPNNLMRVINFCVKEMEEFLQARFQQQRIVMVSNSIRILSRIVPFTFEHETFGEIWFRDDLGLRIIRATMKLLFLPLYTIVSPNRSDINCNNIDKGVLWKNGLGMSENVPHPPKHMLQRRTDLLRLLLVFLSSDVYIEMKPLERYIDHWKLMFWAKGFLHQQNLYYSLINTICGYIPGGIAKVPYSSYINSDEMTKLVGIWVQMLLILIDFKWNDIRDSLSRSPWIQYVKKLTADSFGSNEYRSLFLNINDIEHINFIFEGILRLLWNFLNSNGTVLPGSVKSIDCQHETLVILWKLIDTNPNAYGAIVNHERVCDLIGPLVFIFNENIGEISNISIIQICISILLKLSSEREFNAALGKPYRGTIPYYLSGFRGNSFDLLFQVFSKVILTGPKDLGKQYSNMIVILTNIAPYTISVTTKTGTAVVKLIEKFSQEDWLNTGPSSYNFFILLIEMINNMIQYQWEGSLPLILSMIQNKGLFERLQVFLDDREDPTEDSDDEDEDEKRDEIDVSLRHMDSNNLYGSSVHEDEREEKTSVLNTHVSAEPEEINVEEVSETCHQILETPEEIRLQQETEIEEDWYPSARWHNYWKQQIQFAIIQSTLNNILPQIGEVLHACTNEKRILGKMKQTTMVGILPVPHPLVVRKLEISQESRQWEYIYTWGIIYLGNRNYQIFDTDRIKLFATGASTPSSS